MSRVFLARAAALALVAGCIIGCSSGAVAPGDARADVARADVAGDRVDGASGDSPGSEAEAGLCAGPAALKAIDLPETGEAQVTGVLSGASLNPSTTCEALTVGPDALYTLNVPSAALVELRVTSSLDLVVAVRAGCDVTARELACGVAPLPSSPDADAGASTDHGVRVLLQAGTYHVLVDQRGGRDGGAFTLHARRLPQPANGACALAAPLALGKTLTYIAVDGAREQLASCDPEGGLPSLYYQVEVPAGQRLTARVTASVPQRTWEPVLRAVAACGGTCLAQDHPASGQNRELDYVNNGPAAVPVILAVAAAGSPDGGTVNLAVSTSGVSNSCDHPTPLADGVTLLSQRIASGPAVQPFTCGKAASGASLFYEARLLPQQTAHIGVSGALSVSVLDSCASNSSCTFAVLYTNDTDKTKSVLFQVQPVGKAPSASTFDLFVEMPPPPAGIRIDPPGTLKTSEGAGTATFQVRLASPPTAPVTIALTSSMPTEGVVAPASLRFDSTNWSEPQTVTVTGVDDQANDGDVTYFIRIATAVSADGDYNGLYARDVRVVNADNDAGFALVGAAGLITSESGATATFAVRLNSRPVAQVRLPLVSSDPGEGVVSPSELLFSPDDWNAPKTVTVTGVDDALSDGGQTYEVAVGPAISADPAYGGRTAPSASITNLDNDYGALPGKLLGDASGNCRILGTRSMAADRAGRLYILLSCNNSTYVVTSADGGRSLSTPRLLPLSGTSMEAAIVATDPGVINVVAYDDGLHFTRSVDGGATWTSPVALGSRFAPDVRLSAAGSTVAVLTWIDSSPALYVSPDAGRTFTEPMRIRGVQGEGDVKADPDGVTITTATIASDGVVLTVSHDGGLTFEPGGVVATAGGAPRSFVLGRRSLFVVDVEQTFWVVSLDDPTQSRPVPASFNNTQAIALDPLDNAVVTDLDSGGQIVARRLDVGAAAFAPPATIGPGDSSGSGVLLAAHAYATVYPRGQLVLFAVIALP